jgi:hypothetical protein
LLPDDSLEPGCQPLGSYEAVGEAAFGPLGRKIITFVLYTELIGTCGLFFILEGDHISVLLNSGPESKVMIMIASALVMVPTTWFRDLSGLSKLGFLGACASFGMLGVILYTFVSGGGLAGASPEAISSASLVHAGGCKQPTLSLRASVFVTQNLFNGFVVVCIRGICDTDGFMVVTLYGFLGDNITYEAYTWVGSFTLYLVGFTLYLVGFRWAASYVWPASIRVRWPRGVSKYLHFHGGSQPVPRAAAGNAK